MLENINSYDELIEHLDKKSAEFVPAPYRTKEEMSKRWGIELEETHHCQASDEIRTSE